MVWLLVVRKWNCWQKWINLEATLKTTWLSWVLCCPERLRVWLVFKHALQGSSIDLKNKKYWAEKEYRVKRVWVCFPVSNSSSAVVSSCFLLLFFLSFILHNIINQLICTFSSLKKRLELNLLALSSCPDLCTFTFLRLPSF